MSHSGLSVTHQPAGRSDGILQPTRIIEVRDIHGDVGASFAELPYPDMNVSRKRIRVAIVAPSMAILGGQAVQADRLIRAWSNDPDIDAWLAPVNPVPPGALRRALEIKYIRTLATQLVYWPSLVRQLTRADVVHVFSASYYSFLLAPLPAVIVARVLGKSVVMNYRSGEAPDHLKRSAVARTV